MQQQLIMLLFWLINLKVKGYPKTKNSNMDEAYQFLQDYNNRREELCQLTAWTYFNYETELNDENKRQMLKATQLEIAFINESKKKAKSFAWTEFKALNGTIYNDFKDIAQGNDELTTEKRFRLEQLVADMENKFSTSTVCCRNQPCKYCSLDIEPGLTELMAHSHDYNELAYAWTEWRDSAGGSSSRAPYFEYVALSNEAAALNGFPDAGAQWRSSYDTDCLDGEIKRLWTEIWPLYVQLHTYVRRKLIKMYPGKIRHDGPIPAHILGNMWAQNWQNLASFIQPYPKKPLLDVTPFMKKKNMTILDMFHMAEDFFTSLGFMELPPSFWQHSVFEKPKNRKLVCHASSFDLCTGNDFRVKMCTEITMDYLLITHHELGHIHYYQEYAHLPLAFRAGANPGFHEAVGDTIALSVAVPEHYKKIGLLEEVTDDEETSINFLLSQALQRIALLGFAIAVETWRWKMFDGSIKDHQMNTKWWDLRLKYQGVCPPVKRTEKDFDAIAKYHIASSTPYISYFTGVIIQFQIHKALCKASGHKGPLHKCDIYGSKEAGDLLRKVLSKGASVSWTKIMEILTDGKENNMNATGVLLYFEPLIRWLEVTNKAETLGWTSNDSTRCPD